MWSSTGELVGRSNELAAVRHALRDRAGTHLLVIEGAPGIGKTRLLDEAAAAAATGGARVLRARGSELERELPFGVMRQLLEPVLRGLPEADRAALLDGDAALAVPALDVRPTHEIADAFAVLAGVYWLIAGIASAEPLVLCVRRPAMGRRALATGACLSARAPGRGRRPALRRAPTARAR